MFKSTQFEKRFTGKAIMWNFAALGLALGAFIIAIIISYRKIHYSNPNDLRSPTILVVNVLLATMVAIGFAVHERSLARWTNVHLCLGFGLWSAAIFYFVPPIINEYVLFLKGGLSPDVPYIMLGACIHGGLTALLSLPFAGYLLKKPIWDCENLWEICGIVVLIFYIVACIVRLTAENWW